MPEMDGLEATRAIRAIEGERGGHVLIVAMTASAMKGDRERCLAAGMDDYVSKPIDADRLNEAIERCRSRLGASRATAKVSQERDAPAPDGVIDLRAAGDRLGGVPGMSLPPHSEWRTWGARRSWTTRSRPWRRWPTK
jgi:DNA-binding NarL/FixJ family response regulator